MAAQDPRRPNKTDVEVGRLVRALRMAHGLSQAELGERIGVTFQMVQKYESGVNRISMGRLAGIAEVFAVHVVYLLGGSKGAASLKSVPKDRTEYAEIVGMLGLVGAQRLLKAFLAIPSKPASLREGIVQMVEYTAKAASAEAAQKRAKRR